MPSNAIDWIDFIVGGLLGFYLPVWQRQRDYDCFGKFQLVGSIISGLYSYFNEELSINWFSILMEIYNATFRIYSIYEIVNTCTAQLDDYAKDLNYIEVLANGDGSV